MALRALQGPAGGSAPVGGSGTTNTIPRWTGPTTLGDSGLIDDGTQVYTTTRNIGIGTASPTGRLHVVGGTAAASTNGAPITIVAQSGGTGNTNGGDIVLTPGALSGTGIRGSVQFGGHLLAGADNTYDIGASGATRPRTVYVGTSAVIADGTIAAATGATQPYVTITATGSAANIGVTLQPKGTAAISAQLPDGAATGGNARGPRAVDLQLARAAASMVASGSSSFCAGENCTASGNYSVALGFYCTAQNTGAVALGYNNNPTGFAAVALGDSSSASGSRAVAIGQSCTASGNNSFAACLSASAYLQGQFAAANGLFGNTGDAQRSTVVARRETTTAAAANLTLNGGALGATTALVLPNNRAWAADVHLVARSATGADHAYFVRRALIKRDANAASTALVGTVQTIGTDIGSNAGAPPAGWAITITADTTNGALDLQVTGAAGTTIRWVARVELVEVGLA